MTTPTTEATAQRFRDRISTALMLLVAVGALSSFVGAIATVSSAARDTQVLESWRMWGFLVFAGLFTLLALAPRSYPGIWELVILHKTATALTAATLIETGAPDAPTVAAVDAALALLTVVAYVLARGFAGWTRLRSGQRRAPIQVPT